MNLYQKTSDFIDRISMRISKHILVDGIWVGSLSAPDDSNVLENAAEALSIIRMYDSVRYLRICRDINSVWFVATAISIGTYKHRLNQIELDVSYCGKAAPEVIASLIVHEATHARLMQFGYDEALRPRIERICIKQEIKFARKLPNGQTIVQWASERLNATTDEFYTDVAWRERRRERELDVAQKHCVPLWFIRILQRRADKKQLQAKPTD